MKRQRAKKRDPITTHHGDPEAERLWYTEVFKDEPSLHRQKEKGRTYQAKVLLEGFLPSWASAKALCVTWQLEAV